MLNILLFLGFNINIINVIFFLSKIAHIQWYTNVTHRAIPEVLSCARWKDIRTNGSSVASSAGVWSARRPVFRGCTSTCPCTRNGSGTVYGAMNYCRRWAATTVKTMLWTIISSDSRTINNAINLHPLISHYVILSSSPTTYKRLSRLKSFEFCEKRVDVFIKKRSKILINYQWTTCSISLVFRYFVHVRDNIQNSIEYTIIQWSGR